MTNISVTSFIHFASEGSINETSPAITKPEPPESPPSIKLRDLIFSKSVS